MPLSKRDPANLFDSNAIVKPFLRWAGGKSLYTYDIINNFPPKKKIRKYYEPFLGAGSIFLAFKPQRAILSDLNGHLIQTFLAIKENPTQVYNYLKGFENQDSESYFYKLRDKYNQSKPSIEQAAMFIYLNKACFNGIFRVNKQGFFNVPYGHKKNLNLPTISHLIIMAELFKTVDFLISDYKEVVVRAGHSDLIYLDPPYPPINSSSYFTHYTKERFSIEDQEELAKMANELSMRGSLVVISNADTYFIRELYKDWHLNSVERVRYITCSKVKHKVKELIITNYEA
jgi:DNA adenine methylase